MCWCGLGCLALHKICRLGLMLTSFVHLPVLPSARSAVSPDCRGRNCAVCVFLAATCCRWRLSLRSAFSLLSRCGLGMGNLWRCALPRAFWLGWSRYGVSYFSSMRWLSLGFRPACLYDHSFHAMHCCFCQAVRFRVVC